jgi:hypothetical protein
MRAPKRLKGFYCGLSHPTIASTRVLSTIGQVVRIGYCVSWMVGRQQTQSFGSPEACERRSPSSSLGSRRFGTPFAPMISEGHNAYVWRYRYMFGTSKDRCGVTLRDCSRSVDFGFAT